MSFEGLLNGSTATGVIAAGCFFGLFFYIKSKENNAKLLKIAGIMIFFSGLLYLGPLTDFLFLLLTGKNLKPIFLYGILSYMWITPALIPAMYLSAEIITPSKKKIILTFYSILGIIFELFLWLDTLNAFYFELDNPGNNLIDASFNKTHPTFLLIAFFLLTLLFFNGFGLLIKIRNYTGDLKKRFSYLSIAYIIFVICGFFDSLIAPGIALFFVRIGMMTYPWFFYAGLKNN
ncbi:MAG: hypothetical protein ACFFAO_00735 [Candidatus Hermodarchaeota archaeon]